ncbi:MAG: hypothetical protein EA427_15305 [Spirochaetaceae bacterium]|nr:MAG: hypothetical protein EA427_15305 [Spirochaetaceae bacterium]
MVPHFPPDQKYLTATKQPESSIIYSMDGATAPLASITFFHLRSGRRWHALKQMRSGPTMLEQEPGMRFSRLMGTGRGIGFDPRPNFRVYSVLAVWDSLESCHRFLTGEWYRSYSSWCDDVFTVLQFPLRTRGTWGGANPFEPAIHVARTPVRGVITRATIRTSRLISFWKAVPRASRAAGKASGRIFSVGIGELPLVQQATYSLWEDEEAITRFAYRGAAHKAAIRDTHRLNWYSEELFARFAPVATIGRWWQPIPLPAEGITRFEAVPPQAELLRAVYPPEQTAER